MLNVQYVTDSNGKPLYVQVPIKDYEKLLADAEALADIAAYKKAKKKPGNAIPFDEAFAKVAEAEEEPTESGKTIDELIAAGVLQPADTKLKRSLSDVLNQFTDFPLTYEDAKALRRDAWKRNG